MQTTQMNSEKQNSYDFCLEEVGLQNKISDIISYSPEP